MYTTLTDLTFNVFPTSSPSRRRLVVELLAEERMYVSTV